MAQPKQPTVGDSRDFNIFTSIWIVPLIALTISLWLVYQHFSKLGPEIRIVFKNSGGLAAGQSVIKFKNVPVGKITRIEIQKNGEGVVVIARMNRESEAFMNETTRFWIVKPKVDYSGISGLETLISGSYISMYAQKGEESKEYFSGLDTPYRDFNSGDYFLLRTLSSAGVKVGAPISYHNIQVGQVEHVVLSSDNKGIDIVAFIKKDYSKLINTTTKFWVQSLASVGLHGNRLDINVASVISHLAFGGITFETKLDKSYPKPQSNYFFRLYDNRYEAETKKIGKDIAEIHAFSFKFKGKISGLKTGESIRYQGFDIGEVTDIELSYDSENHTMRGSILGEIDVSIFADGNRSGMENLQLAVNKGMRAQLTSANPFLDVLYIEFAFAENVAPVILRKEIDGTVRFPVVDVQRSSLVTELTEFTNKLNGLKIDEMLESLQSLVESSKSTLVELEKAIISYRELADRNKEPLNEMIHSIDRVSKDLDTTLKGDSVKDMPTKLNTAIEELGKTLKMTKRVLNGYRSNSLFGKRVTNMLKEINRSSEETKRLLRKLNKKPDSLIFGD